MGINRGKQFEEKLREQFQEIGGLTYIRLYDVTMGYKNIDNICDLVVYRKGTLNLFELKAIHRVNLKF